MATVATQLNSGTGFSSGETVTASKLNNLVNTATVTGIVNADIDAGADIAGSKLADGAVTNAKVNASAAIAYGKLALTNSIVAGDLTSASVTAAKLHGAQTGSAPIYGCRAWVNFNGNRNATDTGASTNGANVLIRGSGNVASVLKTAPGDYTITFTTAMPDANYCVTGIASSNIGAEPNCVMVAMNTTTTYGTKTDSAVRIFAADTNAIQVQDVFDCNVVIFR